AVHVVLTALVCWSVKSPLSLLWSGSWLLIPDLFQSLSVSPAVLHASEGQDSRADFSVFLHSACQHTSAQPHLKA
ncbi:hypothetical protein KUCAC02_033268, partial [Chaenocephalus aceratus]